MRNVVNTKRSLRLADPFAPHNLLAIARLRPAMTRRSPGNLRVAVARARVRAVAGAKSRHHRYAEGEIFATRLPALLQNADPSGSAPSTAAKNALAPLAKLHRSTPPFWPIGPPAAPSESQTEMAQVSRRHFSDQNGGRTARFWRFWPTTAAQGLPSEAKFRRELGQY
jgi:hypothetical protein